MRLRKRDWLENIVEAVGERLTTFQDIIPQTRYFFTDEFEYEPKAVKKWWGGSDEKREKTGPRCLTRSLKDFRRSIFL